MLSVESRGLIPASPMNNNILFDRLNKAAVMLELKKGSVLFHPGDPVMGVYVVREGRIILTWPRERKLFQMYIAERVRSSASLPFDPGNTR